MKTRKLSTSTILLASLALLLQLSTSVWAQDDNQNNNNGQTQDGQAQEDQTQDPPGRVARLSDSQGSISFRPASEDDWVSGTPNRPMVTGDDLWADEDSRAEVTVGSAAIRLGAKTGITFLELDDHLTQIRLAEGSLIVNARHVDDDDNYEIDTPNVALTLLQPGEYRIDVSEDGSQTVINVFHGRGRVTGGGDTRTVVAGQSATFTGSDQLQNDQLQYDAQQLPAPDDFDSWAFNRDEQEDDADSANYVSREMTGYEDLDAYGDWSDVAGYGACWQPRALVPGWAPYRFGHWIWVGPWGWTWVENEPWGFAPFHYGRWAFENNRWFWVPGPAVARPVWAPALVAFVGGPGSHPSASVGWFPLAPGEVYLPGYRVSRAYVNNVNMTNTSVNIARITNVYDTVIVNKTVVSNNAYINARTNAVTMVSRDSFVNARPVAQNIMKVDAHEIAAAPVTHVVAAEPVRSSVMGAGRPVPMNARPPAAVVSRAVVAVKTPPPSAAQVNRAGAMTNQTRTNPDGFKSFAPPNGNNPQVKEMPQSQPRVYEQQGRSGAENDHNGQVWNTNPQTGRREYRKPQGQQQSVSSYSSSGTQAANPLVRPAPPVQQRSETQEQKFNQTQQQRPASSAAPSRPAPAPRPAPSPAPKSEPPKK
jgi:hypothetical protein